MSQQLGEAFFDAALDWAAFFVDLNSSRLLTKSTEYGIIILPYKLNNNNHMWETTFGKRCFSINHIPCVIGLVCVATIREHFFDATPDWGRIFCYRKEGIL